jgi:DNA (cytosine-5)-methyltransferase 1
MIPPGGCARDIPTGKLNGLSRRFDSAYRRLHPDAPSTALSTKYDCVYHFSQNRSLSVREYARLQGVPDRIDFPEKLACRRHAYEMIGNSVPPFLVHGVLAQVAASAEPRGAE